jgi:shikimate dehydrogenase
MSLPSATSAIPRYAVIGNPVAHSRSPRIHALFAEATGERITYERLPAPLGGFAQAVREFRRAGGLGLSVTVPFKLECLALAPEASERAKVAGAANTLAWHGEHWFADNTDGAGLLNDFARNLGVDVRGRDVLILGAGGAARGILRPLAAQEPRRLVIANRTPDKAIALAALFAQHTGRSTTVLASPIVDLRGQRFDIVINSTSASLGGAAADAEAPWPPTIFTPGALAYDLVYAAAPTAFLRWAAQHGAARCADGLGMLVEQAALQFELWRGVLPATGPVLAQLRAEIRA